MALTIPNLKTHTSTMQTWNPILVSLDVKSDSNLKFFRISILA